MVRALVTGATGFIGSHLVERLLRDGVAVRCLVRSPRRAAALRALGAELVPGDVTDAMSLRAAVAGVDVVHHLAGRTLAFNFKGFLRVNAAGTANLAAACARVGTPPVLVYVSSLAAAGPSPFDLPRGEEEPPAPVSHYGHSKRQGERLLHDAAERLPATVVRPPIVFGPRERYFFDLFRFARRGWQPVPSFGPARLSLVHVEDLVGAVIAAAGCGRRLVPGESDRPPFTGVYHVAGPDRLTLEEIGDRVAEAMGQRPARRVRVPGWVCRSAAAAVEVGGRLVGAQNLLNLDKLREAAAGSWTCQTDRAERELGFRPGATLVERLRQTFVWYREQGWL
jgi:nucleoside-diphosphate-sugar epimerase